MGGGVKGRKASAKGKGKDEGTKNEGSGEKNNKKTITNKKFHMESKNDYIKNLPS